MEMLLTVSPDLSTEGIKAKGAVLFGACVEKKEKRLEAVIKAGLARLNISEILHSPVLQGYRDLYRRFDEPDQVPAAESLLRLIEKRGKLPTINTVVDAYNLISASTGLAIGAHDLDKINGDVTIRKTDGTEFYVPMNSDKLSPVAPSKYAAIDQSKQVICWMETRQCDATKISADHVQNVLLYVQGNANTSRTQIAQALEQACSLVAEHSGASYYLLD